MRNKMKVKSKVSKFTGNRRIVEIPKAVRDNFEVGEEVEIQKIQDSAIKRRSEHETQTRN